MLHMNLWAGAINATLQLVTVHTNSVTFHLWESLEYLNQFLCIPQNIFSTYKSFYVFSEKDLIFP